MLGIGKLHLLSQGNESAHWHIYSPHGCSSEPPCSLSCASPSCSGTRSSPASRTGSGRWRSQSSGVWTGTCWRRIPSLAPGVGCWWMLSSSSSHSGSAHFLHFLNKIRQTLVYINPSTEINSMAGYWSLAVLTAFLFFFSHILPFIFTLFWQWPTHVPGWQPYWEALWPRTTSTT